MKTLFKKFDTWLLLHHPTLWSSRLHVVLAIWFPCILFLTGLFWLLPIESYDSDQMELIIPWLILMAIVGIVIWYVFLLRFNIFKRFGLRPPMDEWLNFVLIFTGVLLLASTTLTLPFARYVKSKGSISEIELSQLITNLEIIRGLNSEPETTTNSLCRDELYPTRKEDKEYYANRKKEMLATCDSFWMADSCMTFHFTTYNRDYNLHYWNTPQSFNRLLPDEYELVKLVRNTRQQGRVAAMYHSLCVAASSHVQWPYKAKDLMAKAYIFQNDYSYSNTETAADRKLFRDLENLKNWIRNNQRARFFFADNNLELILHLLFYSAFIITLLTLMFRNMTAKTFFISLGAGALMPLVIVVLVLITGAYHEEMSVFTLIFIVYLVFAIWALTILTARTRNIFQGIALNLFTASSPFLGVFLMAWYQMTERARYINSYSEKNYGDREMQLYAAEIVGIIVFLILLQPLYKTLYTRWYSLPEE
ncbi:MAG: hypothetical protein JNL57_08650 [Bacteroidetes bacterium]|nr:hypothetical protein [Bacteroidota bacterium]